MMNSMVREITSRDLAKQMANDRPVLLLDIRQAWEHELAAIDGSVLIPLSELARRTAEIKPPADALIVVYCHHGVRSLSGASVLVRLGLKNVVSLAGGIDAWSCEVDPAVPRY
jgi:rhodanese-related sulfurtransferase